MEDRNVEIRTSGIHGTGLYAARDFAKGKQIYMYPKGKIVSDDEIAQLPPEEQLHLDKVGEGRYEVISPPACYVNHSCDPNIEERDHAGYALRDIRKGEELSMDYDKVAYLDEPLRCSCGARNCRGIVRGKK